MAKKNAAAVELAKRRMVTMTKEERQEVARLGGVAGGAARAENLTPEERSAAASKAAKARWAAVKAAKADAAKASGGKKGKGKKAESE